jgi:Bacterial capsule synthesis protein PGA_cap
MALTVAAAVAVLLTTLAGCAVATPSTTERRVAVAAVATWPPVAPAEPAPVHVPPEPMAPATARVAAEPARADPFELTFVGDVIFGRYRAHGYAPLAEAGVDVFADVAALLRSDLAIANLETPLVYALPERSPIVSPARFGAAAEQAVPLASAGFHAASLANNHAYDLRRAGLVQTPQILAELGIVALGAAHEDPPAVRVQTLERNGWRIGVLAVATRRNGPKPQGLPSIPLVPTLELPAQLRPLVKEARASHDLLVVLVHWGEEYRATPTRAQRWAAHALVDAGVDLVVGHHPHVLQGIERYGNGVVAYSLGNFLFDQREILTRQTGVLRVRARGRGCLDAVAFHPVLLELEPSIHPVPATGDDAEEIMDRLRRLSEGLGTTWVARGDALVLDMPGCSP